MTPPKADPKDQLLDAALMHVPFDGWSPATFNAAIKDSGLDPALARAVCPRGAVDLAVAYHRRGDAKMLEGLAQADLSELRFRDRIAINPATDLSRAFLVSALGHLNLLDESRRIWRELMEINPDYSPVDHVGRLPFRDPKDAEKFTDGLAKAGLPE